jgi:peptide/nickel transport system substrate-binding protein
LVHWAFNPQARSYDPRDVERAKRLLADAGLASGFPVELTHHTVSETYKSIAQVIQANLSDIGVKVSLMQLELGVWVDKVLRKRDFQLALSGNSVRSDPDAIYSDMYPYALMKSPENCSLLYIARPSNQWTTTFRL